MKALPTFISFRAAATALAFGISVSAGICGLLGHHFGYSEGVVKGTTAGIAMAQDLVLANKVVGWASEFKGVGNSLCAGFSTGLTNGIKCNTIQEANQLMASSDADAQVRGQYCHAMLTTLKSCGENIASSEAK